LYAHLTARDNIGFPLALRKVPKPDCDREVEAEATHLGIRALLGKMPGRTLGRSPAIRGHRLGAGASVSGLADG
jgi:ABC-type sugar transport system ATPase subunit